MRNKIINACIIASILLINTSCKKSNALVIDEKNPEIVEEIVDATDTDKIIIQVVFNAAPTKVSAEFTTLKFNKEAVFNMEWDDNSKDCLDGLAIFKGGKASNGISYPGKSYTDGCGNKISYRAALAINGYNSTRQMEIGVNNPSAINYNQMKTLIKEGWDIENHSLKHESVANVELAKADLAEMNKLLFDRIGYTMNTLVVPSNFNHYMEAASDLGFIAGTTQADQERDGIKMFPTNAWIPTVNLNTLPSGFVGLNRTFNDNWSNIEDVKGKVVKMMNSPFNLFRMGSHNVKDIAGFADFVDHIEVLSKDKLWVTTMREMLEYRIVKEKTQKSEKLNGNTLTITLDQKDIADMIRWRDLSLKIVSDASISTVKITGADKSSYNLNTGLVNVFKEHTKFKSSKLMSN